MYKYEIVDLEIWGNEDDGYEVNDAFHTLEYIEIEDIDDDKEILNAVSHYLKDPIKNCYIDNMSSEETIYINAYKNDMPLIELQLVTE